MDQLVHGSGGDVAPTVGQVGLIAAWPDPVVRNLRITYCYHELSRSVAAWTGGSSNWCTYAVWASKQIGQTIRQEDLTRAVERLMAASPETAALVAAVREGLRRAVPGHRLEDTEKLVRDVVLAVARLDAASAAGAAGNLKVFAEIAHEFARFLAEFADDTALDEDRLAAFVAGLRPGEPPDGQDHLCRAFGHYLRARFDPEHRAELLFLANIEVGVHEQTRLQPEITAAMEAPFVDPAELERRLLDLVLPHNPALRFLRLALVTVLRRRDHVRAPGKRLAENVRALARRAVTAHLMTLTLPDGTYLELGKDLTLPFPPSLATLTDPALLELLARLDPTPDSPLDTAARDWSDLADRLHYIVDMFRCTAERADLLDCPFTADQVDAFTAGRLPGGRL
ncbi:hypothetical protein GCM10022243_10610 [Saccharothrix violaceirubra]|uniref:Uncharacterized protein n=1 Tax=Saccharothrix violaceirubra TaxID=413306 RepID=A0A7W7T3Y8_9PSEU|nr:hypothetical protein [Saccharothrix violaceirubra]MBB4966099.1 hypothetical protein [Saccharothrix violaceirubra]